MQNTLRLATIFAIGALVLYGCQTVDRDWDEWEAQHHNVDGQEYFVASTAGGQGGDYKVFAIMCMLPRGAIKMWVTAQRSSLPDGPIPITIAIDDDPPETFQGHAREQRVSFPEVPTRRLVNRIESADFVKFSYADIEFVAPVREGAQVITEQMQRCR